MSDAIFPTLPGLTFSVTRRPEFKTVVNIAASGRESRIAQWSSPLWHYELIYSVLRDGAVIPALPELQALQGFYLARQGRFDTFLFLDPDDSIVAGQRFGTGDGSTTSYQLVRSNAGFIEPVNGIISPPAITISGSATTAFGWTTSGLITFASAPAAGAALVWSGTFYRRCRFETDDLAFEKFMAGLWVVKSLKMVTVK